MPKHFIGTCAQCNHRYRGVGARFCSYECKVAYARDQRAALFWSHVRKDPGCWEWQGYVGPDGYGQGHLGMKRGHAQRIAWELTNGPIPDGMFVCHRCDNRICVRPDHLFLGTALDNIRDMDRKGRRVSWNRGLHRETCERGHKLSGENLYLHPRGHRCCRTCNRAWQRRRYARLRDAARSRLP